MDLKKGERPKKKITGRTTGAQGGQEIQPRLILRRLGSLVLKCFMHEVGLNSKREFD